MLLASRPTLLVKMMPIGESVAAASGAYQWGTIPQRGSKPADEQCLCYFCDGEEVSVPSSTCYQLGGFRKLAARWPSNSGLVQMYIHVRLAI